jgi:transketolase
MINNTSNLGTILKQIQANILLCSTAAGSGHPTSSLSAAHIMTALFFTNFKFNKEDPSDLRNDRLIFSKGHASPLFFSLYRACGIIGQEELMTFRKFGSRLEGHPSTLFPFVECLTGSLGQGVGVAVGEAIALKKVKSKARVFCLVGDSELAEGSCYEAFNSASYYGLDNLVYIIDLNRLGQRGQTQIGYDINLLARRLETFGLEVFKLENGNNLNDCLNTLNILDYSLTEKPKVIIAKTNKGAGVSFLSGKEGWHGKALNKEECQKALKEIGEVDMKAVFDSLPVDWNSGKHEVSLPKVDLNQENNEKKYVLNQKIDVQPALSDLSTRQAYGAYLDTLIGQKVDELSSILVLDGEMSNSTFTEIINRNHPENFLEMFIAEQNMISVATGLSKMGFIPFCSTFAAFLTRAFDQIRMAQYANTPINVIGSHCGVSIGQDGASQMAIEDIAMFRSIGGSVVLYPSDSYSTCKLIDQMIIRSKSVNKTNYLRLTRDKIYDVYAGQTTVDKKYLDLATFEIGGSNQLTDWQETVIISAGITLFEALDVNKILPVTVIDMYSIKPIDLDRLKEINEKCKNVIVIEDHRREGGLYSAIQEAGILNIPVYSLAVENEPRSGTREDLMSYCKIDKDAILEIITRFY